MGRIGDCLFGQADERRGQRKAQLTPREVSVLRLLVTGISNKEIAKALGISEGTVKTHVSNILFRLDVQSRAQASAIALAKGISAPPPTISSPPVPPG